MPGYSSANILVGNIRPYLKKIWFADRESGCSADVLVFNVNKFHYPKFIYYTLFRDDFFDHMMKGSKGTKMPRGDKKQILDFLIPDFEFDKQQKIAKVLSDLDAKIELNNKINIELEAMAKTLYDYWFVQFDFPDPETSSGQVGKPYKTSGGKMVYNVELKREIPEGWEVKELNECIELILDHRGKTPLKLGGDWTMDEDGIIALSAKVVKGGKLVNIDKANRVSQKMYDKWMAIKLIDGDILMTSEAPAGEFYFIQGKTDYCMSQRLFGIRSKQSIVIPSYLYYELSKGHGYSQILGSLSGSTVFGIRQDVLRTIKVVVPNLEIQKRFNQIVLPQLKEIKKMDEQNQQLALLRDWLVPMLMNGQVSAGDVEEELGMVAEPNEIYKK
jgi:type I restriction enzyme S subunit